MIDGNGQKGCDLVLLHGRLDPEEDMNEWGFEGPTIEGVAWVHWTYGNMNVAFVDNKSALAAATLTGWNWVDDHVLEMGLDNDLVVTRPNNGQGEPKWFGDFELQSPGWRKTKGEGV